MLAAYTYISGFSRVCVCVADYIKSLSQWRCHVAAAALWLVPEQTGGEERWHYLHAEECLVPHHHTQQPQVQQCLKAQRGAEPPAIHNSRAITGHYRCDLSSITSHFSPHQRFDINILLGIDHSVLLWPMFTSEASQKSAK